MERAAAELFTPPLEPDGVSKLSIWRLREELLLRDQPGDGKKKELATRLFQAVEVEHADRNALQGDDAEEVIQSASRSISLSLSLSLTVTSALEPPPLSPMHIFTYKRTIGVY